MMREVVAVILLTLGAGCAMAQSPSPPTVPPAAATPAPDSDSTIHYKGRGVMPPELLPFGFPVSPPPKCKKMDGTVKVFVAVDVQGKPRQDYLLNALGNELDLMALRVAELTTFKPGRADDAPATVGIVDEILIHACSVEEKEKSGLKRTHFLLRSVPGQRIELADRPAPPALIIPSSKPADDHSPLPSGVYRVGGEVSAPRLLKYSDPEFTEEARKKKISGSCTYKITVDEHGLATDPELVKSVDPGLDQNALWSVTHFRFTPAMRQGNPVRVRISVDVTFKLF